MAQVLGGGQTGRLYKAWSITRRPFPPACSLKACTTPASSWPSRSCKPDQNIDEAREILLKTVEDLAAANRLRKDEVDRAKTRLLKNIELTLTNSQNVALTLGECAGSGDWRSFFLRPRRN